MNYTFNNSSIVSVNSGTIVLNVSGKTRTFVDAKLVSAVDGEIVLDLPSFKLTKGAYVVIHLTYDLRIQRTFISNTDNEYAVTYHVTQFAEGIKSTGTWGSNCLLRNATPEEIQELNDQLAAEGKCWNPSTMQIEKYRWKPKDLERYYIIYGNGDVDCLHYVKSKFRESYIDLGNCFQTKEQAEKAAKKLKELFKSL